MIQLPRRSVTRFFIPLIDVLTLLFCIYMLMPFVQSTDGAGGNNDPAAQALATEERRELERLRQENQTLRLQGGLAEQERQDLEKIRREKIETLRHRLAIRVLEIDADTGRLFYYDPDRVELAAEADARALVERQRRETAGRELYYLILFPHRLTGFPLKSQVRRYEKWFGDVAHELVNPLAPR